MRKSRRFIAILFNFLLTNSLFTLKQEKAGNRFEGGETKKTFFRRLLLNGINLTILDSEINLLRLHLKSKYVLLKSEETFKSTFHF